MAKGNIIVNTEGLRWDDIVFPAIAQNIDISSGRVNYNYNELTIDFATNARYPEEPLVVSVQMTHGRQKDSDIAPHIHWNQTQNIMPNILIAYRWYNNNENPTIALTLLPLISAYNVYTYTSGVLAQITKIPLPVNFGVGKDISSFFDIRIYRDSVNTSILFPGADLYTGIWSLKEYDIHIIFDSKGSVQEYVKQYGG